MKVIKWMHNPVPKGITAKPGSPEWWEDSRRFWAEMKVFWQNHARIQRRIAWMWVAVVVLLVISAVLKIVG